MSELLIHMKGKDQFQKKINSNEKIRHKEYKFQCLIYLTFNIRRIHSNRDQNRDSDC